MAVGRRVQAVDGDVRFAESLYENGTAGQAFERRTGVEPPSGALVALGQALLERNGHRTVGAELEKAGKRGAYLKPSYRTMPSPYALFGVNEQGYLPTIEFEDLESLLAAAPALDYDWIVFEVDSWSFHSLEFFLAEGIPTWVICLEEPDGRLRRDGRLTAIARFDPRSSPAALVSPNTRWTGLVSEVDFRATLLSELTGDRSQGGIRTTDGHPWFKFWSGLSLPNLADQSHTTETARALNRVEDWWRLHGELGGLALIVIGCSAGAWIVIGAIWWQSGRLRRAFRRLYLSGLVGFALFPAATILAAHPPFDLWSDRPIPDAKLFASWLALCWLALAFLLGVLRRRFRWPLFTLASLITLGLIVVDLFIAGGSGIHRSIFGLYLWEGARVYGLDNNYAALIVAMLVCGAGLWMERAAIGRLQGVRLAQFVGVCWLMALLIGAPVLGANGGGFAFAVVSLGGACIALSGQVLTRQRLLALFAAGLLSLPLIGWIDSRSPADVRSHLGRAYLTAQDRGIGEMVSSKLAVVAKVVGSVEGLAALAAFFVAAALAGLWLRRPIRQFWSRPTPMRRSAGALGYGCLAAILFNDSGLVMAGLLIGCLLVSALEQAIDGVRIDEDEDRN